MLRLEVCKTDKLHAQQTCDYNFTLFTDVPNLNVKEFTVQLGPYEITQIREYIFLRRI